MPKLDKLKAAGQKLHKTEVVTLSGLKFKIRTTTPHEDHWVYMQLDAMDATNLDVGKWLPGFQLACALISIDDEVIYDEGEDFDESRKAVANMLVNEYGTTALAPLARKLALLKQASREEFAKQVGVPLADLREPAAQPEAPEPQETPQEEPQEAQEEVSPQVEVKAPVTAQGTVEAATGRPTVPKTAPSPQSATPPRRE